MDTTTPESRLATLRYGVTNLEARVASARARTEESPSISAYWVELDRSQWALSDMREQLHNAERTMEVVK